VSPLEGPVRVTWTRTVTEDYQAIVDIEDLPSHMADAYYRGATVDWTDWLREFEDENDPVRLNVDQRTKELVEPMVRGICMRCDNWSTPYYTSDRVVEAALIVHANTIHGVLP